MKGKIVSVYGKPVEEMTKEELITALNLISSYYETQLEVKQSEVEFLFEVLK